MNLSLPEDVLDQMALEQAHFDAAPQAFFEAWNTPAMLRYLGERGIRPGARLEVTGEQPFGGPLLVEVDGREHALGSGLADKMRVHLARSPATPG